MNESSTIQAGIVDRLSQIDMGWSHVPGDQLARPFESVLIEAELVDALKRLNPLIAEKPERIDEVLPQIRARLLSAVNDGLVTSNEAMVQWLRGTHTHRFVGTENYVPIRLIDFDNPRANRLVVSDEVTFRGADERRFDVVLWVNGIPLVVGEMKTPFKMNLSWLDAATDITNAYEKKSASFFVPNVFNFASDGTDYRYGAVGQPAEMWLPWGSTTDDLDMPPLKRALRSVELMLRPELVLDVLRYYTLYSTTTVGNSTSRIKIIPRYPQVEAARAIVERAKEPGRNRGLIWHHQGSGKTFLMGFAAVQLLHELDGPTVLVVLDRLDLIEQTSAEFTSAGVPRIRVAQTKDELRQLLADDARGVIITTIFRFEDAGFLNDRENIIVLVDEAHRTQEGRLGADIREALPNAQFFGLTGTPISNADRNTFTLFGDPDDPHFVLNHYSIERSIADGATLPVHVETRLVDFHLNHELLDEEFAALVAEEGLTDDERDVLARRASHADAFMKDPKRVRAVCADIVEHYFAKIAPLGLKAQVVAGDRELCVLYLNELRRLLGARGESAPREAEVVMTVGTTKTEPPEWQMYERDRAAEATLKARFKNVTDPLAFMVVTAKLLTGFDAPIEGAMYLDKPLRAHTLFQAITRTNRRWTNPLTRQEKQFGLVVDYVGVGEEIARSLQAGDPNRPSKRPLDIGELVEEFAGAIERALARFSGIDRTDAGFAVLMQAQQRLHEAEPKAEFATEFLRCSMLWEFLSPDAALRPYEDDYRWLAKLYASVQPSSAPNQLLWHRLGAKTLALVHGAITDVQVGGGLESIALDDELIEVVKQLDLGAISGTTPEPGPQPPKTAAEVLDSIEARIKRLLTGNSHPVWVELSARLEDLRLRRIVQAEDSVEFLKHLLQVARDVLAAERAEREGNLDEVATAILNPNIGALTQILREYGPPDTPVIVEAVVTDIDTIVRTVRFTGWQQSQPGDRTVRQEIRQLLRKYALPAAGPLFDRVYGYVSENY